MVGAHHPSGIALNGTHIFWSDCLNGTIGRANLSGTGVDNNFITRVGACDVEVDESHIYWLRPGVSGGGIGADLDGDPASVNRNFIRDGTAYIGLSLGPKLTSSEFSFGKKLKKKGKAKVTATVTFTADGGEPNTESTSVKLKKK